MKIIITEQQFKGFIKTQNIIIGYYNNGLSVDDIHKYTSIPKGFIYQSIMDLPYKIHNCQVAYDVLTDLMFHQVVDSGYKKDDITITTEYDSFAGVMYFIFTSKNYRIDGMATPFWDGHCFIPIDWCMHGDFSGCAVDGLKRWDIKSGFKTIGELVNWYNSDYFEILTKVCIDIVKKYPNISTSSS